MTQSDCSRGRSSRGLMAQCRGLCRALPALVRTAAGSGADASARTPTRGARASPPIGVSNGGRDALDLPFEDATFDVICCQFGVMFFPDRVAGYAEARRVLRPGGRFVFSVWDRIEENDFADDVTNAVAKLFPHDPPLFLARTPHGYHDIALIREELRRAGFADITISTREELSCAPSARHAAAAYCHGTPLRNEIEARDAQLASTRDGIGDCGNRQPPR